MHIFSEESAVALLSHLVLAQRQVEGLTLKRRKHLTSEAVRGEGGLSAGVTANSL